MKPQKPSKYPVEPDVPLKKHKTLTMGKVQLGHGAAPTVPPPAPEPQTFKNESVDERIEKVLAKERNKWNQELEERMKKLETGIIADKDRQIKELQDRIVELEAELNVRR